MATCNNCGKKLSCGCKKRTANDGKSCCADCVGTYNKKLTTTNQASPTTTVQKGKSGITSVTVKQT